MDALMTNEEFLNTQANAILDRYRNGLPGVDEEKSSFSSLQKCAWFSVIDAFKLLMAQKNEQLAKALCQHAIDAANTALECGSYERMFFRRTVQQDKNGIMVVTEDETFKPSKKQKHIEESAGRMNCYKSLYYANWFMNNNRDNLILTEVLGHHREVYDLYWHSPYSVPAIENLVRDYIEVGDYSTAMQIYETKYKKAVKDGSTPKNYSKDGLHVLYLYAQFALGDSSLLDSVIKGLDYWIDECRHWSTEGLGNQSFYPMAAKMTWAYLYCSLTGSTDIDHVLQSIRG